jgi:hypothetical protein
MMPIIPDLEEAHSPEKRKGKANILYQASNFTSVLNRMNSHRLFQSTPDLGTGASSGLSPSRLPIDACDFNSKPSAA